MGTYVEGYGDVTIPDHALIAAARTIDPDIVDWDMAMVRLGAYLDTYGWSIIPDAESPERFSLEIEDSSMTWSGAAVMTDWLDIFAGLQGVDISLEMEWEDNEHSLVGVRDGEVFSFAGETIYPKDPRCAYVLKAEIREEEPS